MDRQQFSSHAIPLLAKVPFRNGIFDPRDKKFRDYETMIDDFVAINNLTVTLQDF